MGANSSRLSYLLGEMRRQMNGAVVGSMRFYGAEYGLNYGVSLPTIRAIAKAERDRILGGGEADVEGERCDSSSSRSESNHRFARLLYQQEVRELRLAALWLADVDVVEREFDFWCRGIVNSEVAEEAAFALFHRCKGGDSLIDSDNELLQYCGLMSVAKGDYSILCDTLDKLYQLIDKELHILPKAIVVLLDSALKRGVDVSRIQSIIDSFPASAHCGAARYIREEMEWRIESLS